MSALDSVILDLRHGVRLVRRQPLLSAAIVVTLALGVGLDGGVFTLVDGMLLRPRVAVDPETFVQIDVRHDIDGRPAAAGGLPVVGVRDYTAFRAGAQSIRPLAAWAPAHAVVSGGTTALAPAGVVPLLITCNFFAVFDGAPLAGRALDDEDCSAASASVPAVVIGEALARDRFGSSPAAVGADLLLDGKHFTVVGVMRETYDGRLRGPVWVPYTAAALLFDGRDLAREPSTPWLTMVGRLAPEATRATAGAELAVIARQQDALVPGRTSRIRLTNGSMLQMMASPLTALWIVSSVMGALTLVLIVACANVAMLLLSRSAARRHEIAVRVSLGATGTRLVRMLITETVLLGAFGFPLSAWLAYEVPVVWKSCIPTLPYYPFHFDSVVFAYLSVTTLAAGCIAALLPALESIGFGARAAAPAPAGGTARWRTAEVLVTAQLAIAFALVAAAGVLVQTEIGLRSPTDGIDAAHVLLASPRIAMPPHTPRTAARLFDRLAERVGALPGVRRVGRTSAPPAGDGEAVLDPVELDRVDASAPARRVSLSRVGAGYVEAIGISPIRGRTLAAADAARQPRPILVSAGAARLMAAGGDPLGGLFRGQSDDRFEIVGIVPDLPPSLGDPAAAPAAYVAGEGAAGDALVVRFSGDAAALARAVEAAVRDLDPGAAVQPETLAHAREELARRFMRIIGMVIFLVAVAIGLALGGLYGVAAFAAGRRRKEIGIRIALGATRADIVSMMMRTGSRSIARGLALGLPLALALVEAQRRALVRVPAGGRHWLIYPAVGVTLAVVAALSTLAPARLAATVDPTASLREE
jgi:putative ABC transport system permease protein